MNPSNIEILAYETSPLGILCLRRRELLSRPGTVVTEITLNHEFLMGSYDTASERALAQYAIEMHPGEELRVLVGGLGLGYTAREVLASDRVIDLVVVEFLPQVIDWFDRGLFPLAEELKADSRLKVIAGDIFKKLLKPPEKKYDLVLIDVDHSPEEHLADANASFYTEGGLALAKRHLTPAGLLAVWSYAECSSFEERLRGLFREVRIEQVTFKNYLLDSEQTDWLFFART